MTPDKYDRLADSFRRVGTALGVSISSWMTPEQLERICAQWRGCEINAEEAISVMRSFSEPKLKRCPRCAESHGSRPCRSVRRRAR